MSESGHRGGKEGHGGNGGSHTHDRCTGVDRRIADDPEYHGPERRQGPRRRPDRHPDKPLKR
jgi:hypothetical protein